MSLKNQLAAALTTTLLASSAFSAILDLGSVKNRMGNFDVVSTATAQGRHGKYTIKDLASGEVQARIFGAWRKVLNAQILVQNPQDFGGDLDKLVQVVSTAKAAALRMKPTMNAPAHYIASAFEKAKQTYPELNTPKGEMDQIIAAFRELGSRSVQEINLFVERSSATIYFELNGTLKEIESSENFFSVLVGLWAKAGSDSRSKIRIIFR